MLTPVRTAGTRPTMPESRPGPATKPRRRLLLVDDNAEGRRALGRLLEIYGYEVTTAGDGTTAIQALHQTPSPEIVLTDLLLPDVDGREIARQAQALVPRPIVIMITGWD